MNEIDDKTAGWIKTKYACPSCKTPLMSLPDRFGNGVTVWCAYGPCVNIGANEGGHGKSEAKALEILMAKMGLGNYVIEATEDPIDAPESSPGSPVVKGKRGRKAKGTDTFQTPPGEWTIKEFCDLNKTYPVKVLAYIEANGCRECGVRPPASGRGRSATLYTA